MEGLKWRVIESGILLLILTFILISELRTNEYTVQIVEKDAMRFNKMEYVVYAEDSNGNTKLFKNSDCWVRLKLNSDDIHQNTVYDHKYLIKTNGFEIPAISMYENIIDVKVIE